MQFIPVVHKVDPSSLYFAIMGAIIRLAGAGLFSLIEAFKQNSFGLDTLYALQKYQKEFRQRLVRPCNGKLYIDSGGYSFIKGQIHPNDIVKLINCYLHYLIEEMDNYYKIFSLDLPKSLKYNSYKRENILYYNRLSLLETFNVIKQIPQLAEKFIFIWQFRTVELYQIWCQLYDELCTLGYQKYIKNVAIGGLVGIKGMSGINFSPFIALAYRCFKDYVVSGMFDIPFRLHLLGVYTLSDRFIMAYMERVFEKYLMRESITSGVVFTYDSINYERQANYFSRELPSVSFENGQLHSYSAACDVPDHILRRVYHTDTLYLHVVDEINRIKKGERLASAASFSPLSLYNHLSIDKFIEDIIERYDLVDIIFKNTNIDEFLENIEIALDRILTEETHIFGPQFKSGILDNLIKLYRLHRWWSVEGSEYKSLNSIIEEFIQIIWSK